MKTLLISCSFAALLALGSGLAQASEAVYFPTTGRVVIPQLTVDGDAARTIFSVELQQRSGGLVFDVAAVTVANTAPGAFTSDWLKGRTLYQVWFGKGQVNGITVDNVAVVVQLQFNQNNTVAVTGLLNESPSTVVTGYTVDGSGRLSFGDDTDEWNIVVCNSTSRYVKTHFFERGAFDNVDHFYFDRNEALAAADVLTSDLPRCPTAP